MLTTVAQALANTMSRNLQAAESGSKPAHSEAKFKRLTGIYLDRLGYTYKMQISSSHAVVDTQLGFYNG